MARGERMTPIDELRRMLDELRIKYTTDDSDDYEVIEWQGPYNIWWQFVYDQYEEEPYGELRLLDTGGSTHLTPEQAIAATVGTEPDEATMLKLHDRMNAELIKFERALGVEHADGAVIVSFVARMHEIIDDAATVGAGTCKCVDVTPNDWDEDLTMYHMECGFTMLHGEDKPRFCGGCGRKVVDKEESE